MKCVAIIPIVSLVLLGGCAPGRPVESADAHDSRVLAMQAQRESARAQIEADRAAAEARAASDAADLASDRALQAGDRAYEDRVYYDDDGRPYYHHRSEWTE